MSTKKNETATTGTEVIDFTPNKSDARLYAIYELGKLQREAHFKYGNAYALDTDEFNAYNTGYEHGDLNLSLPEISQLSILDCTIIKDIMKPLMYNDFDVVRLGKDVIVFFGEGSDIVTLDNALNELYPNNNRTLFNDDNAGTKHYQLNFYFDVDPVDKE